jgi:phenylalanyl-tRNA synthetase alpha chain
MSEPAGTPLHPLEVRVLSVLTGKGPVAFEELVSKTGLLPDQVRRAISWLTSKGLVVAEEKSSVSLVPIGASPPELALLDKLEAHDGPYPVAELKKSFQSNQEFSAAIGRASSAGWVSIGSSASGPAASIKDKDGAADLRQLLKTIAEGKQESAIPQNLRPLSDDLLKRGLIRREESRQVSITISKEGAQALSSAETQTFLEKLTPEVIATIRSGGEPVRLRPIDVSAAASRFSSGRRHPVKEFINEVREAYLSMGFSEIIGDAVQSSFWNFDALFTPQDHPARELQDTFYVKGGRDETLRRTGVVSNVASAHEDGWKTGSKGWRYSWDVDEARRLVLRTHNTALTIRATMDSAGKETRVFSVGRVYRNENLDYKHLAELHQMEGIVIGEGLNLRHLKGILTQFYAKLGMSGVKLWPSFFPYTEPSMQVMVYYDKVGKWLEMGGSGIFRPEVTLPLGVNKPVIAWGCGLERLLMLKLGVEDIRDLYNSQLEWLRGRRDIASSQDLLQ